MMARGQRDEVTAMPILTCLLQISRLRDMESKECWEVAPPSLERVMNLL